MDYLKSYDDTAVYDFYEDMVYTDAHSNEQWWNEYWYKKAYC